MVDASLVWGALVYITTRLPLQTKYRLTTQVITFKPKELDQIADGFGLGSRGKVKPLAGLLNINQV